MSLPNLLPQLLPHLLPQWKNQGFDPSGKPLVLAVSGGADSMAMLHFFYAEVAPVLGAQLHVGHVQHGLRPEAEGDADFVSRTCQELGIECQVFRLHPEQRLRRESVEAWARRERYAVLTAWSQRLNALLLTAHHRDDWIETVLLRMTRGEDWRALLGMPFHRDPGIVRPFLSLPGSTVRAYLHDKNQNWCHDTSNDDDRFTRNFLRHQILPRWDAQVKAESPEAPESAQAHQTFEAPPLDWRYRLWQMGQQMHALQPWLEGLQPEAVDWEMVTQADGSQVQYPFLAAHLLDSLLAQGETAWALRRLRALVRGSGGPPGLPKKTFLRGFQPIQTEIGQDEVTPQYWSLSRKWRLKKEKTRGEPAKYRVEPTPPETQEKAASFPNADATKQPCIAPEIRIILDALPGEWSVTLAGQNYRLRITPLSRMALTGFPAAQEARVVCDAKCFSSTLVLRTRQAGDRFSPLGIRSRTRKLKAFLHEKGVPASQRNSLPLVFHEDDLVWVPGYGLSEWFKVTPDTETLYEMVLECLTTKIP